MYTIYADGKLLHAPHLFNEGCGVLSPKLTVELNKAGSLDYVVPPTNVLYDEVKKLKTIITAFQNGEELFRGRVLHDEKDFYKQKSTYCEGEFAFLLDSVQRPYTYDGTYEGLFRRYISNHNASVEVEKRFTVGNVTVTAAKNSIYCENTSHSVTQEEITSKILDVAGGYMKIRSSGTTRYIDWLEESGEQNTQTIEFGINLLDLSEHITAENIFTVLIPIGASLQDSEGNSKGKLSIVDVNNGKDYLENQTAISLFGRIEKTNEWSDIDNPSTLKQYGERFLANNIELAITLTLKAVDLYLLDVNVERLRLGDWVRVISLPHSLDKNFQCTKIVYDMSSPDQTEYTFGVAFTSLTEKQVNENKTIQSSVTGVQSAISAANASANRANQASKDAENVIAQIPTDYVKSSTFDAFQSETREDIIDINSELDDLRARVSRLEGGTM